MRAGATTVKNTFPNTWHVGNFTVSTHLLPKFYDPNSGEVLEPSAVYYVPTSTPTELVARSLSTGRTQVVTKFDCTKWGGLQPGLTSVPYPFFLVQCGSPPSGTLSRGILVDAATGATWTLWTKGGMTEDGAYGGQAVVSGGWVYFNWGLLLGPQGAMNLATGVTESLPFPISTSFSPYLSPDGTLFAERGVFKGKAPATTIDLYRLTGLKATLVAYLPEVPSGIDANGTIWVSTPGGSLTSNAGAMTIRVWNSGINLSAETVAFLDTGPGYVLSRGSDGSVRVTLATSGGSKTITVSGYVSVGNFFSTSVGWVDRWVFPASNGRWQILTVSGG